MRTISIFASVLVALTPLVHATSLNCVNINADLALIEKYAETGQYRQLSSRKDAPTFTYDRTKSYDEYLAFAKEKINVENPKAQLKCPIETGVTEALNISKEQLVVTDLIAPFELKTANSNQAVLLVHGLTDSPYLFHDLATLFYGKGLNVRTLLLPGHATAPEALTDVEYEQWQQATRYAIARTLEDYEHVYLGGFSTGGALILDTLLSTKQNVDKLKGIMLWAPASKAKSSVAWAAQFADWIPFLDYTNKGADIDFAKYESFPLNAGAQVHSLMSELENKLSNTTSIPDIPLLTITTEVDSTIDTQATITLLTKWHNAQNRQTKKQDTLLYFGHSDSLKALPQTFQRFLPSCSNDNFCSSIIDVAHTSVTNSPNNPHYGWKGSYRNCEILFGSPQYKVCKTTAKPTLGETTAENLTNYPSLQRLTFNPYFEEMTKTISTFMQNTQ